MRKFLGAMLALSSIAACAGSDAESDSGSPTESVGPGESNQPDSEAPSESTVPTMDDDADDAAAPVQDMVADAAAAEAALLTLSDFPAGWSEIPHEADDSNEEMLDRVYGCLGPAAVEMFNSPTKARTGDFTDPADDSGVNQTAALFPTTESAEGYMAGGSADGVAECLTTVYREELPGRLEGDGVPADAEFGEITVGSLNVGQAGEETFAYRVTAPVSAEGFTVDIVTDFVAVRVGRSVTGLNFQSFFDPTPTERIVEYASLAASRLPG
jgi:hypothetical protein